MVKKIIPLITLISFCLLLFLLNTTTPATAGPFGIMMIFFITYIISFGIITYVIYFFSRAFAWASTIFISRKPIKPISYKNSYYFASIISAVPIMLIGLQSVGAIGIYGLILVLIFMTMGLLYVSKKIY